MDDIAPIVIEPKDGVKADSSFIFLHGLGDEGSSTRDTLRVAKSRILTSTIRQAIRTWPINSSAQTSSQRRASSSPQRPLAERPLNEHGTHPSARTLKIRAAKRTM